MPLKVQVGPPQIAIHAGQTVLITEPDGQVSPPTDKGLFFFDTRLLNVWRIGANGEPWSLLNGGAVTHDSARVFLTNREFVTEDGTIPARCLSLVIARALEGGMHEDIDITNHGMKPVRFNLEVTLRSDFADLFEVKRRRIVRRGRIITEWEDGALRTAYRNRDFVRAVTVTPARADAEAVYANGRLSFEIRLDPSQRWHTCLLYALDRDDECFAAPAACCDSAEALAGQARTRAVWQSQVLKIRTSNEEFYRFFNQALDDMAALRLTVAGSAGPVLVPAAGLPWFVALFGRDSLLVSLQAITVHPEFAFGTLDVLGLHQATERDDYRDAEPGKILHELRCGELAHFGLIPHTPYYGTADATPLYLVLLHEAWRASGDRGLIERHLGHAEACLDWIDHWGDRDGDGFQEYQTRSPVGYANQAWKDAGDSVRYQDGTQVEGPKALCELQGYVYDAWLRMAEIYDALNHPARATALRDKAATLFRCFNEAFWDDDTGFYAYLLDGRKRQVLSVASNPGHLLFSGLVPPERAARVVARMMAPDMNSGWGIRTLSADHSAFNPYSYQNGSVWPHDNSLIALGFARYGFHAEAVEVARDISRAASFFQSNQVPELYAGVQRKEGDFPVQYLGANVPQAWAAGSAFVLVQAILGIAPDAPRGRLCLDPHLPSWLPDITLTDLRMGDQVFDIRFWRDGAATRYEVLRGEATRVIRRSLAAGREALRTGRTD